MQEPTAVGRPWAKPYRGLLGTNGFSDGVDNLETELRPVFNRASISVRTLVGDILQELIDQVAIRTVNFYAVESCFIDRIGGGCSIQLNVLLDFCEETKDRERQK
jgi:hypothetical protein